MFCSNRWNPNHLPDPSPTRRSAPAVDAAPFPMAVPSSPSHPAPLGGLPPTRDHPPRLVPARFLSPRAARECRVRVADRPRSPPRSAPPRPISLSLSLSFFPFFLSPIPFLFFFPNLSFFPFLSFLFPFFFPSFFFPPSSLLSFLPLSRARAPPGPCASAAPAVPRARARPACPAWPCAVPRRPSLAPRRTPRRDANKRPKRH
jgi:hypothetical protein